MLIFVHRKSCLDVTDVRERTTRFKQQQLADESEQLVARASTSKNTTRMGLLSLICIKYYIAFAILMHIC